MATIHVNREGTNLGTFSEDDVRAGLRSGRFVGSDLAWREGMATWQPLSQFSDFAADLHAAAAAAGPAAPAPLASPVPPPPLATPTYAPTATTDRTGLPWDRRREKGFFNALVETIVMVLTKPDLAFRTMKREGGFGEPVLFAIIGGSIGAIVAVCFSLAMQSVGMIASSRDEFAYLARFGIGSGFLIILIPLLVVIWLFIGAAIVHVCLMIVGGAKQSFETTFRVLAFTHGAVGILQIIPVCGGLIALVWAIIAVCIGLARAHETDTGRAVLAVFLPLIVCCGFGVFSAVMIPTLIHHASH